MNNIEKTFQAMAIDSLDYLNTKKSVWETNSVMKKLVQQLTESNELLNDAFVQQSQSDKSGHITQKGLMTSNLAKVCYKTNRKLTLYAKITKNAVLLNDVDVSESVLLRMQDKDLILYCMKLLKAGRDNMGNMVEYGITVEELDVIEAKMNEVKQLPAQISVANNDHKIATQNIRQIMSTMREILDQTDDAIEGMIHDELFTEGWFYARKIKGRHNYGKNNGDKVDDTNE